MLTTKEVITGAIELISDPERWTYHAPARTDTGAAVAWDDKRATCWCGLMALRKVAGDNEEAYLAAVAAVKDANCGNSILGINDWNGREAMITAMRRAL